MSKKRALKRFNKAVECFIKADEKEQQKWLKRIIKTVEQDKESNTITNKITATVIFTEAEIEYFTEPFKTLFSALDRAARVTKMAVLGGGVVYGISFRRYGYNLNVTAASIEEAKQKFIERARVIDDEI